MKSVKRSKKPKLSSHKKKKRVSKCRKYLSEKIKINMNELKNGRFKNRKQAIAVSYSQVKKDHPACRRFLNKKVSFS